MKHLIVALSGVILASSCLGDVALFGGSAYEVVYAPNLDDPTARRWDWWQAQSLATGLSYQGAPGHLVTIHSKAEDDFVLGLTLESGVYWAGGLRAMDGSSEDRWMWVNGEGAMPTLNGGEGYANWAATEPANGSREAFLAVGQQQSGMGWRAESWPEMVAGFIVEYPVTASTQVPEPSSLGLGLFGLVLLFLRNGAKG